MTVDAHSSRRCDSDRKVQAWGCQSTAGGRNVTGSSIYSTTDSTFHSNFANKDALQSNTFTTKFSVTQTVVCDSPQGPVLSAVHRNSGKKVAVTLVALEKDNLKLEEQLARLRHQLEAQCKCSEHANIAQPIAAYLSSRHMRIVTEALEGGSLKGRLAKTKEPLDESAVIIVIAQVLQAVEHLHDKGVAHRGLTLESILYQTSGSNKVKLADFSQCTEWTEGMPPMARPCGSLQYAAPEVMTGAYGREIDLWCVGVIAHALLTKEFPRWKTASDRFLALSARMRDRSEGAQDFVKALLSTDPASRLTASGALRHRWVTEVGRPLPQVELHEASQASPAKGPSTKASRAQVERVRKAQGAPPFLQRIRSAVSTRLSVLVSGVIKKKAASRVSAEMHNVVPAQP